MGRANRASLAIAPDRTRNSARREIRRSNGPAACQGLDDRAANPPRATVVIMVNCGTRSRLGSAKDAKGCSEQAVIAGRLFRCGWGHEPRRRMEKRECRSALRRRHTRLATPVRLLLPLRCAASQGKVGRGLLLAVGSTSQVLTPPQPSPASRGGRLRWRARLLAPCSGTRDGSWRGPQARGDPRRTLARAHHSGAAQRSAHGLLRYAAQGCASGASAWMSKIARTR